MIGAADGGLWLVAVLLIGVPYNTHTSTTIAFLVSAATMTVVFAEPRFVLAGVAGLLAAIVLSAVTTCASS